MCLPGTTLDSPITAANLKRMGITPLPYTQVGRMKPSEYAHSIFECCFTYYPKSGSARSVDLAMPLLWSACNPLGIVPALRVEMPQELAALTSDEAFRGEGLESLRALGRTVGIKRVSLARGVGYIVDRRIPYGIVRGLSDMPARRTRVHYRTLELRAWPNLPVGTVPEGKILHAPAFAFVVLPQVGRLATAWEAAEDWQDWNVCTCALVVRSTDVDDGTGNATSRLGELSRKFDFVFSISNHLLRRPVLKSRSEAVEQRGTRSAEACITGMLDLADAMGFTSRDEFVRKMRSRGLALFGSAIQRTEQSGFAAVDAAMASTREPVSRLDRADVLLLAAPGLVLEQAAAPRSRSFRRVEWSGKSSLVRVFAFGLEGAGRP